MSQTTQDVFQSIMTGLQEAIDYEKGTLKKPVRTRVLTIAPLPHYQGKRIQPAKPFDYNRIPFPDNIFFRDTLQFRFRNFLNPINKNNIP